MGEPDASSKWQQYVAKQQPYISSNHKMQEQKRHTLITQQVIHIKDNTKHKILHASAEG